MVPGSVVADIGSGTGILSELLLKNGNPVFAVEPNQAMRHAAEQLLGHYVRFRSVDGTAEATGLEAESVDFVVAAQAFHWFKATATRTEFKRIAKRNAWVVLIWNDRRQEGSPFLSDYESLLQQFGTDYQHVNHRHVDIERIQRFFHPGQAELARFVNVQNFDWPSLLGRLRSSSYVPNKGSAGYEPMLAELRRIFETHSSTGVVQMEYDTLVYYGQLDPRS
jgi:ubiquinone/menaquinone biosynthesis C-methylase UbiE